MSGYPDNREEWVSNKIATGVSKTSHATIRRGINHEPLPISTYGIHFYYLELTD